MMKDINIHDILLINEYPLHPKEKYKNKHLIINHVGTAWNSLVYILVNIPIS